MEKILMGNEAIVQGAMEAGVQFVSAYPGTPSSEIGDRFSQIAQENNIYFEFSVNEKVAMEAAIGASFSGLKTLVSMKNFGLNVASDAFLPFVYTGTVGPTVIVVADDPSCHSSGQSEENTRGFAELAHVPILEPADAKEAKDFTKLGFEISQNFSIPVILRITTRVAHQRMPVEISNDQFPISKEPGKFVKNKNKFVTMPPRVMEMKEELLRKIKEIGAFADKNEANRTEKGTGKIGIITSGVSYLYVKEVLQKLDLKIPVLKLGFFYPFPKRKINNFIKGLKKVLVVEELEGYLEKEINVFTKNSNCKLEVYGKNWLPVTGELNTDKVASAIGKLLNLKIPACRPARKIIKLEIPTRFPNLCQGCPYWLIFAAIKRLAPEGTVFGGDIGCYMLAGFPPHEIQDYLLCMGSSIGIGHGIKKASGNNQKLISLIGDSTFFHAGIPGLINSVYNKSNLLILVLDNRITAMTGHQPNAGMQKTGMGERAEDIRIENIAKACGVKNVAVIDPINVSDMEMTIKDFMEKQETSVIVMRRMCAYLARKLNK
ncbi:MAG: thiamine pyrophosphate-dependent enzyme [bacterium]|nr:thiamine pyrophosphate-dependent enzyme [bacterium]